MYQNLASDRGVCSAASRQACPWPQFKTIAEVEGTAANSLVDVLGVVTAVEPATSITLRNGTGTVKRPLTILDASCKSVEVPHHCEPPLPTSFCTPSAVLPSSSGRARGHTSLIINFSSDQVGM